MTGARLDVQHCGTESMCRNDWMFKPVCAQNRRHILCAKLKKKKNQSSVNKGAKTDICGDIVMHKQPW